jgi:hypothetical protein
MQNNLTKIPHKSNNKISPCKSARLGSRADLRAQLQAVTPQNRKQRLQVINEV